MFSELSTVSSSPVVALAWSLDVDSQLLELALRQASGEEMGVFA